MHSMIDNKGKVVYILANNRFHFPFEICVQMQFSVAFKINGL